MKAFYSILLLIFCGSAVVSAIEYDHITGQPLSDRQAICKSVKAIQKQQELLQKLTDDYAGSKDKAKKLRKGVEDIYFGWTRIEETFDCKRAKKAPPGFDFSQ